MTSYCQATGKITFLLPQTEPDCAPTALQTPWLRSQPQGPGRHAPGAAFPRGKAFSSRGLTVWLGLEPGWLSQMAAEQVHTWHFGGVCLYVFPPVAQHCPPVRAPCVSTPAHWCSLSFWEHIQEGRGSQVRRQAPFSAVRYNRWP